MDRFFILCLLVALLAAAPLCRLAGEVRAAQPVFFSLLFPQLLDMSLFEQWLGEDFGEAVAL